MSGTGCAKRANFSLSGGVEVGVACRVAAILQIPFSAFRMPGISPCPLYSQFNFKNPMAAQRLLQGYYR